jgi:hypothetical protein
MPIITPYTIYTSVKGLTLKRLLEGILAVLRCDAILLAAAEEIAGLSYLLKRTLINFEQNSTKV